MSGYYGDFLASKTVRCRFNTLNSSGVPTSLTSGAVTVSKDGIDVTPTTPPTLTVNQGGVTGRNVVVIDMSVDATAYSAGAEYAVRLSGSSAVGGNPVVGIIVGEWSVANRSIVVDAAGIVNANAVKFAGTPTYAYDGILAGATATTVTFPATDAAGNAIPDDGRFRFTQIEIVGATGVGQMVALGLPTATPHQYSVVVGTMPVPCDSTSQYVNRGSIIAELDHAQAYPTTTIPGTTGDALSAARAQGFGKWTWPVGSTTVTLFAPDGNTPIRQFTVDSATQPRNRS